MEENQSLQGSGVVQVFKSIWLEKVPSYGNKIFYSLGFLSMTAFFLLLASGIVLVFFGPDWWITSRVGIFVRSIHLWAAQAFVVFIILHVLIVFLTGGYRPPRRLVWVLGALMFFLALFEAEFGYVLRSDFSSQWRSLQGADFWNGSGLGVFINNLNYAQIYGIHVILIPFLILGLLFFHYALVKLRGIAPPYKKDFPHRIVKANHTILFLRGVVLVFVILFLAVVFPSPLIAPVTIKQIAKEDPVMMADTLIAEINHTSDTATYVDNIAPYKFNTKTVYIDIPYSQYLVTQPHSPDMLKLFDREDKVTQEKNLKSAQDYFDHNGRISTASSFANPVIPVISSLVIMGQSGLYEASLRNQTDTGYNSTYALRFLADTGALDPKAEKLGITTQQYGMLREGKGILPPGAWWLAPLGVLDHTVLKNDDNQDRDGAEILGIAMLIFVAFPYIPLLNELPDKFGVYKLIWKDK